MKLSIISDLHIESAGNNYNSDSLKDIMDRLLPCDVRLIAGDLTNSWRDFHAVMELMLQTAPKVYIVGSNHLFYSGKKSIKTIHEQVCQHWGNIVLDCHEHPLLLDSDISIIGDTGWWNGDSIIDPVRHDAARLHYNDLRWIRIGGTGPYGSNEYARQEKEKIFINKANQAASRLQGMTKRVTTKKLIVMTHWAPQRRFAKEEQSREPNIDFSGFYAHHALGNISIEQAKNGKTVLHIFGHVHGKIIDEMRDGVRWLSNPRGYKENSSWTDFIVNI